MRKNRQEMCRVGVWNGKLRSFFRCYFSASRNSQIGLVEKFSTTFSTFAACLCVCCFIKHTTLVLSFHHFWGLCFFPFFSCCFGASFISLSNHATASIFYCLHLSRLIDDRDSIDAPCMCLLLIHSPLPTHTHTFPLTNGWWRCFFMPFSFIFFRFHFPSALSANGRSVPTHREHFSPSNHGTRAALLFSVCKKSSYQVRPHQGYLFVTTFSGLLPSVMITIFQYTAMKLQIALHAIVQKKKKQNGH